MQQTCVQHPKIEAVAHCKRCKLPVCCHCVEDLYCPECIKLQRYVALGHSGRKPQLVETVATRSRTMELMIARLQAQAFDPDAASIAESRQPKSASLRRKPKRIKTRSGLGYGLLLPGIAPFVRVTRSPMSRMALLLAAAFGLGTYFAHPRTTLAEPGPAHEQAAVMAASAAPAPEPTVRTHYKPIYIFVGTERLASTTYQRPAYVAPVQAPRVLTRQMIAYAPAIALPVPAAAPVVAPSAAPAPATLAVAFPSSGGTMRATSYVKVHVSHPERLKEVSVSLDGKPVQTAPTIAKNIEVPVDTSMIPNGDHTLEIVATQDDGEVITSKDVPVSIYN